ncbi:ROK family protein [Gryllotalpicola reticulitermitis]|uniref:ROK family protein n=1 Tax=Gryllotalpicola reticulitermitis TaxID=1184153 RepID=A0ABV8Q862_9MICO
MAAGAKPALALDIGGTKLAVAVVTPDGVLHGYRVEPTRRDEGPGVIIPRLFEMGHAAIADAMHDGVGAIGAVGISCGGPLDAAAGVLVNPLHLPGWIDVPIVRLASEEFGAVAVLENDATAGALAEYRFGAGRGTATELYLTVSTGIGGGAVVDGRLHRGAAGNGGEFGHIMVRPGGRNCLCGRKGCLEAYASGTSIAARAMDALAASDRESALRDIENPTAADVVRGSEAGDALAGELWAETTEVLAIAVTDLINVFEPDIVVLGGGVTRSGAALLDPVRTAALCDAMRPAAAKTDVVIAELGDTVCVVGAAALAFDAMNEVAHV